MKSETLSVNFSYFATLKFIGLSYALNASFPHVWFCNMHWSFGKYWFTELCQSSKCWHISLYSKTTLILPLVSSDKSVRIRKLSSSRWIQVFQNSHFHSKSQILSVAANTVSCFSWRDSLTTFVFKKNFCQMAKSG